MKRLSLRSKVKVLCIGAFAVGLLSGMVFDGVRYARTIWDGPVSTTCLCQNEVTSPIVTRYIVGEDDTLWTIAEGISSDEVDIRETVYKIRKVNKLRTAEIYPGDVILIPVEVIND